MSDAMLPHYRSVCESWSRAVTSMMWNQWKLLDAHYAASIELLDAVRDRPAATDAKLASLEHEAAERVRKGLPPPREVYEVQNRDRIDWSRFPDWARPIDPEVFEGCGHEG
jgi:hypothetical protein